MSMTRQERAETASDIANGLSRPDLLMAEYMRSKGVEIGAEIDKMRREGVTKENQRALHKALAKHFDEELDRCIDKYVDRQIMVGNHLDLARTFARMSILQSC